MIAALGAMRLRSLMLTRRRALSLMGALGCSAGVVAMTSGRAGATLNPLRIRTLTAGVNLANAQDRSGVEAAVQVLREAKRSFERAGFEVQTTRIATAPWVADLAPRERERTLADLQALDRTALDAGVIMSIGPVLAANRVDESLAAWAGELARTTRTISFSVVIASAQGVHDRAAASAAQVITRLAQSGPDGAANFRFAAAANIPAGTPFFPVAWHRGAASLAIGVESAGVVNDAFTDARDASHARERLEARLEESLKPIAELGARIAAQAEREYLGIDASPAPGMDRSIGRAIEAFTKAPFGAPGTLEACAVVTEAIKAVSVRKCGYSGLMLPVLEDPVLALRAGEGRYGVRELLLYSSVCGTGLDVVPIPGDTPAEVIAALLRDVAALSHRLSKPLSARLFVVPGKKAGELARFNDPLLTDCVVMNVE